MATGYTVSAYDNFKAEFAAAGVSLYEGLEFTDRATATRWRLDSNLNTATRIDDSAPAVTGTIGQTGPDIVASLNSELGSEAWQSGPDDPVTITRVKTIATTSLIGSTDIGDYDALATLGYHSVGDGGGALWRRLEEAPDPVEYWHKQTQDDVWLELYEEQATAQHLGSFNDVREGLTADVTADEVAINVTGTIYAWDQGKNITIGRVGTSHGAHRTTVASVNAGAGTITLTDAPVYSLSDAKILIGSDDTIPYRHAFFYQATRGRPLYHKGRYFLASVEENKMPDESDNSFLSFWDVPTIDGYGFVGLGAGKSVVYFDDMSGALATQISFFEGRGRGCDDPHLMAKNGIIDNMHFKGTFEWFELADTEQVVRGATFMNVWATDNFEMRNSVFEGLRGQAIVGRPGKRFTCANCYFKHICAGGVIVAGQELFDVSRNKFEGLTDDCIFVGSKDPEPMIATGDRDKGQVGGVIFGNEMVWTPGIKIAGAKSISCVGNIGAYTHRHFINVQQSAWNLGNDGNGCSSSASISVVGNTTINHMDRAGFVTNGEPGFDEGESGNGVFWISDQGSRAGSASDYSPTGAIPGDRESVTDEIVPFYGNADYWASETNDLPNGPMMGIVFADNTAVRTTGAATNWSDLGFSFTPSSETAFNWDPEINELVFATVAWRINGRRIRHVKCKDNTFVGIGIAAQFNDSTEAAGTVPKMDIIFDGDQYIDFKDVAIQFGGLGMNARTLNLTWRDCIFDGDPFHQHAERNANGSWNTRGALRVIEALDADMSGIRFEGTTFRNISSITESGGDDNDKGYFERCVIEATLVTNGDSVSNKGVRYIPYAGKGFLHRNVQCDPTAADFGTVINECAVSRGSLPTAGSYLPGHMIWNCQPTVSSGQVQYAWMRLTDPNADSATNHVDGTDWLPLWSAAPPA